MSLSQKKQTIYDMFYIIDPAKSSTEPIKHSFVEAVFLVIEEATEKDQNPPPSIYGTYSFFEEDETFFVFGKIQEGTQAKPNIVTWDQAEVSQHGMLQKCLRKEVLRIEDLCTKKRSCNKLCAHSIEYERIV